jgi:hypothetical protein
MKRSLVSSWPVVLLLVFVASCGKEKSSQEDLSQYFIKCKIGSVDKTFNISAAVAKKDLGDGRISYDFFGKAVKDANNLESIGFTIQLKIPLAKGTYKVTDPTEDYSMMGLYNPNTVEGTKMFISGYDESNPFQLTFTEITATTLTGSFSGKLDINGIDPTADSAIITNGQFKVKIQ